MPDVDFSTWPTIAVAAAIVLVAALIVHRIGRTVLRRLSALAPTLSVVVRRADRPAQLVLPLVGLQALWHAAPDKLHLIDGVRHASGVLLIAAACWLLIAIVRAIAEAIVLNHPVDVADNLQARRVHTQTRVLARTASAIILFAGIAFILMTFPGGRRFGTSLLASAGVAGLVLGLAARSVVGNLLAGLQIALAQPIRIDDVLIVEGEWGRVEEIRATYVVLQIWDERRLIIPLQWFIEHPFQNWTRRTSQIIGSVFLWLDYTMPLEPLRAEARRVCEGSADWDGRVCLLQVTDSNERAMQLRVIVSSASSSQNWDLRCAVREALITYAQRHHPDALPRVRTQSDDPPGSAKPAPV